MFDSNLSADYNDYQQQQNQARREFKIGKKENMNVTIICIHISEHKCLGITLSFHTELVINQSRLLLISLFVDLISKFTCTLLIPYNLGHCL